MFQKSTRRLQRLQSKRQSITKKSSKSVFHPQLEELEVRTVPTVIASPLKLRAAYGIDQIRFGASGIVGNGAGQTIALVVIGADDASLVADLQTFDQAAFGPAGAQLLNTFGSYNQPNPGSSQPWFAVTTDPNFPPATNYTSQEISKHDLETAEDVEWAHAIAPMANILVVETGSIQSGTGYAGTLQAQNPSWGISVIASSSSHFPSFQPQDYNDANVAYVGIAGDTGTSIYSQTEGFGPEDYPASTPDVIAVGGTSVTLNPDDSYGSETGWGFAGPDRFLTSNMGYFPPGFWTPVSGGFSGTYYTEPGGSGSTLGTFSTAVTASDTLGVNDSGMEVSATWTPSPSNADNAEYVVSHYDTNGNLLGTLTVTVNQQLAPTGTVGTQNGRSATFQELCAFNNVSVGDAITVYLEPENADGNVVADAIGLGPDDASGGGLSDQAQPSFQNGLVIHNGNSIISSDGLRAYPDVAFDGDYINSPVPIVNQGQLQPVAGTSLGAPAWAGLIAIADQGLATVGHAPMSTAQALAGLYSLPSWDFHDETSGYNGYSAGPGYDLVTGLGSPIANQLVIGLDNTITPVSGPLIYEAPEGQGSNNIQLFQSGSTTEVLDNSTVVASAATAEVTSIDVIGAQHQLNTLTLDFNPLTDSDLLPAPVGIPINFDGGSPGGTLVLEGGNFTSELDAASDAHSGTLTLDSTSITYEDLAPIIDTTTATTLTIVDPLANDQVTVGNDPNSPENGVPTSQISGSGFEKVDFANKTNVIFVDTSTSGSDTINVLAPLVGGATFTVQQVPEITNGPATGTATVGTAYSFAYTAQGSPAPSFQLVAGSQLPPGLMLSASGVISGTPTTPGTYTGTVEAGNGVGSDAMQAYSITVLAAPTITASASPAAVVLGTGVKLTASATLTNGFNETGTVTFELYGPSGFIVDTETVPASGNGSYRTPQGYLPSVIGVYQWVASYGGDANNASTSTVRGSTNQVVIGPGLSVVGTSLYIVGGATDDRILVAPAGASLTGSTGVTVTAELNNISYKNTYTQHFASIFVLGFGGNDTIQFVTTLTIPATVDAGNGNDTVRLGAGNASVVLGTGTDSVTGGAVGSTGSISVQLGGGNNDQVTLLGNGNDTVQVGNGNDDVVSIAGGGNEDVLVGNGLSDTVAIAGNGNETVQTGTGTGTLYILGTGKRALRLGSGWKVV